jgi:hypothetical protein
MPDDVRERLFEAGVDVGLFGLGPLATVAHQVEYRHLL